MHEIVPRLQRPESKTYKSTSPEHKMIASTARITESGQISIPPDMAEILQLVPGTEIDLMLVQTGILLKPKSSKLKISAKLLKGFLQHSGPPVPLELLCKPVVYHDDRI